jgi:ornithine carbamoyltransferase
LLEGRSFTRVADWSREELLQVLDLADELKRKQQAREEHRLLPGRTLGMIFQKPSTRTGVSFEVGIYQLGGTALYLSAGGSVELTEDPRAAAEGAEVLYTDVWTSMGQDAERERRLRDLAGYCIDTELLERADRGAIVLHCLPAHYGEEITEEVLYGPRSAVWDEAENRLHAQKALMALVIR